jgi:hypothetical protein
MRRAQSNQHMDMVLGYTDGLRYAVRSANQPTDILVQARTPTLPDIRMPVLRAEHDVEMEA